MMEPSELLRLSAAKGHVAKLRAALRAGGPVDGVDGYGRTALMEAAATARVDCIEALLLAGANVSLVDVAGKSALAWAAKSGSKDVGLAIAALAKAGSRIDAVDGWGRTALFDAVFAERSEAASALIKAGADLNKKDNRGWSVLDYAKASGSGIDKAMEQCLESLKTGPSSWSPEKKASMLWSACESGDAALARELLEGASVVDVVGAYGMTPLIAAASAGQVDCVDLLIRAGADVDAVDYSGQTALMWAAKTKVGSRGGTCEALCKAGARHDLVDSWGRTALLLAVLGANEAGCRLMLDHGANAYAKDNRGVDAFGYAESMGDERAKHWVAMLSSKGLALAQRADMERETGVGAAVGPKRQRL